MKINGERFLNDEALEKMSGQWKKDADKYEKRTPDFPYYYPVNRIEGKKRDGGQIDLLHNERFIEETIPVLIKNNPERKIKILDVGGGTGLFAKQIREIFGSKVEVLTTGLVKQSARVERASIGESTKLHQNDLKWRSVLELSDFPEFDLIIDTMGEGLWGVGLEEFEESKGKIENYLNAVAKKLLPGGHASITQLHVDETSPDEFRKLFDHIEQACGVKIDRNEKGGSIKIYKSDKKI
ncbi:MAG: hypothetical protein WCV83_00845 [Candidatus Magasanikbacteria bacterium]|jgi:hypothetical protein